MATVRKRKPRENRLLLQGVSWRMYERVLRAFEERRVRITYDRGDLEISTFSVAHQRLKHLLSRLLMALAEEMGFNIAGFGSMYFKRRSKKRGLEPDECYWIQNEHLVRGKREYRPDDDQPPDLVLEVDISRSSLDRIGIYEALGVAEVWRWDGETLEVHILGQDDKYSKADRSRAFPGLKPTDLMPFLAQTATVGEMGMVRAFRQWVRARIAVGWSDTPAAAQDEQSSES
jgi:Uma2 family endonuclease